jgi:transcriptional regulator with XRE-family HTH domain
MAILDEIRQAIEKGRKTRYRIAQDTGISEAQLCRLMSGQGGLSIEALEMLADYLGYEVVLRKIKARKQ